MPRKKSEGIQIPSNERVWMQIRTRHGAVYYVTSKDDRQFYFLYKEENGVVEKLGKSKSPKELEEKYVNYD